MSFFSLSCYPSLFFVCFCVMFLSFVRPEFLSFHLLLSHFSLVLAASFLLFICFCLIFHFPATRVSYFSFAFVSFFTFLLPEFLTFHLLLSHFSLSCYQSFLLFICFCLIFHFPATRVSYFSFAFVSFFTFLLPEFLTFHLLLSHFSLSCYQSFLLFICFCLIFHFPATRVSYFSFAFVSFFTFLLPEFLTFHMCLCHFSLSPTIRVPFFFILSMLQTSDVSISR